MGLSASLRQDLIDRLQIIRVLPGFDHVRNEIIRLTTWKLINTIA